MTKRGALSLSSEDKPRGVAVRAVFEFRVGDGRARAREQRDGAAFRILTRRKAIGSQ